MAEPQSKGFSVVSDEDDDDPKPAAPVHQLPPPKSKVDPAAIQVMLLALKALSARALIAIADLFSLITVLTVFYAFMSIPEPSTNQLVGLGGYAVFVVVLNIIVRRK